MQFGCDHPHHCRAEYTYMCKPHDECGVATSQRRLLFARLCCPVRDMLVFLAVPALFVNNTSVTAEVCFTLCLSPDATAPHACLSAGARHYALHLCTQQEQYEASDVKKKAQKPAAVVGDRNVWGSQNEAKMYVTHLTNP